MKRVFLISGVLLATLSMADFTVRLNRGDIMLSGATGGYKKNSDGTATYVVKARASTPAILISKKDGLELRAKDALNASSRSDGQNGQKLVRAVATGGTEATIESATRSATATGAEMVYLAGSAEDRLDLVGNVKITDLDKGKLANIVATGNRGFATFDALPQPKRPNRLRTGELRGNVTLRLRQPKTANAREGTYNASGELATFNFLTQPGTITLSGAVKMDGQTDPDAAEISGVTKLILQVDENGALLSIEAVGEPVRSEFTRKGGGAPR
jgi:hypothetical protein